MHPVYVSADSQRSKKKKKKKAAPQQMAKLLKPSFSFVAVAFGPSSKIGVYPQKHAHSQLGLDLRHKRPAARRGKGGKS